MRGDISLGDGGGAVLADGVADMESAFHSPLPGLVDGQVRFGDENAPVKHPLGAHRVIRERRFLNLQGVEIGVAVTVADSGAAVAA